MLKLFVEYDLLSVELRMVVNIKVLINPKNLKPNASWQFFRKVRAVVENKEGKIAISRESGKYIFPGGKCDCNEDNLAAIKREIREEMGIDFDIHEFQEILELEALYDDAIDYKTNLVRPRRTITTYYYVKTDLDIDFDNMNLEQDEIESNFKISFVDKGVLFKMLSEKHKNAMNWHLFYEENQIILNEILKNL